MASYQDMLELAAKFKKMEDGQLAFELYDRKVKAEMQMQGQYSDQMNEKHLEQTRLHSELMAKQTRLHSELMAKQTRLHSELMDEQTRLHSELMAEQNGLHSKQAEAHCRELIEANNKLAYLKSCLRSLGLR